MKFLNSGKPIYFLFGGEDVTIPTGEFEVSRALGVHIIYLCNAPNWDETFKKVQCLDDPSATSMSKVRQTEPVVEPKVKPTKKAAPKAASTETLPKG